MMEIWAWEIYFMFASTPQSLVKLSCNNYELRHWFLLIPYSGLCLLCIWFVGPSHLTRRRPHQFIRNTLPHMQLSSAVRAEHRNRVSWSRGSIEEERTLAHITLHDNCLRVTTQSSAFEWKGFFDLIKNEFSMHQEVYCNCVQTLCQISEVNSSSI